MWALVSVLATRIFTVLLLFVSNWISSASVLHKTRFLFIAIFYCYYYHYLTHCASRSISFVSFPSSHSHAHSFIDYVQVPINEQNLNMSAIRWKRYCSNASILWNESERQRNRRRFTRVSLDKNQCKNSSFILLLVNKYNIRRNDGECTELFFCVLIRRSTILQSSNLSILWLFTEKIFIEIVQNMSGKKFLSV